jgi:hypothetical protein
LNPKSKKKGVTPKKPKRKENEKPTHSRKEKKRKH